MSTKKESIKSNKVRGKDNRDQFAEFCGVWTAEEATQFLERISELETVESEGNKPR
ncbi:MAG: hypothetical protein IMZ54_13990 [Acidobacteria bacterium]|nr:hypothetical protein [Acidobacteriota bacterium]MBE3131806.1 hypothetical protein [Acidobacteriota bacterium]